MSRDTIYATKQEVIDTVIIPSLAGFEKDFDVERIFERAFCRTIDRPGFIALAYGERYLEIVQECALPDPADEASGVSAEQLLSMLVAFYAQQRNCGRDVAGSSVLIEAARLLHDEGDDEASDRVAEMIDNYMTGRN